MKIGDLVKFVGDVDFYRGRIGIICDVSNPHNIKKNRTNINNCVLVYFPNATNKARATTWWSPRRGVGVRSKMSNELHPMNLSELDVIS